MQKIKALLSERRPISSWEFKEEKKIVISGFAREIRNLGTLSFIKLADQSGTLQLVFNRKEDSEKSSEISKESILLVEAILVKRKAKDINHLIEYGEWEGKILNFYILSKAKKQLPFSKKSTLSKLNENLLGEYRYLDLRFNLYKNLILKSKILGFLDSYLREKEFIKIETPILSVSSKEGANTFETVFKKNKKDYFFSLSQSPQLYKQLLMISGFERYFQFANCFRREDLRSDRQYEFLQLDIELSYLTEDKFFRLIEEMFAQLLKDKIFQEIYKKIEFSFESLSYQESIKKYFSDKPDLRIKWEIKDFSETFPLFSKEKKLEKSYGIFIENLENIKEFEKKIESYIEEDIREFSKDIFAWKKEEELSFFLKDIFSSPVSKEVLNFFNDKKGILFIFDDKKISTSQEEKDFFKIGKFRNFLVKCAAKNNTFKFLWILDWPLFLWDQSLKKWTPTHHLFTKPNSLPIDPKTTTSLGYDLVLNGVELGSGSVRNDDLEVQTQIFKLAGLSEEEIEENFGWFLEAFNFGVPPHLGIAIGVDRLVQVLLNLPNIRDVIAFPKNSHGFCKLTKSPKKL